MIIINIMSPVNSYASAVVQIKAGADEIYVGLQDDYFERLTFSGRAKTSSSGINVQPDEDELKRIISYAHEHNVIVNFAANIQTSTDVLGSSMKQAYLDYVKKGIELGVDNIIVGDYGNILLLNENKISKKLVSSVFLSALNSENVKMLKELNVKRIVLQHHMKLSEIESIKKNNDIVVEVFVGVGCSNIEGSCHMIHNCGEQVQMSLPCKSVFGIIDGEKPEFECNFLDATLDCALCRMGDLYNAGVDAIKIVGRDQDYKFTSTITRIHRMCIDTIKRNGTITDKDIQDIIGPIPWWKNFFCRKGRCKYKTNIFTDCYV